MDVQGTNMVNPTSSSSSGPSDSIETSHDVFLSFGGGNDTITGDLHAGLCREHIKSYFDEESHETSDDEIGSQLVRVIQSSKIAIIVLSQNYVSSKWCLDELVHTLKCREINRQIVVPVFLRTPSDVPGSYDTAFAQLKNRLKGKMGNNKMQAWRAAVKVVTSLSGWDSCSIR